MAKNLQVNLAFTADTSAAMQNLQTLRNSLNEISSLPFSVGKGLNQDLRTASNSAQQLQRHLGAAMDVKTGNLNLNKLQSSLKGSNQSLSQLTSGLLRAGTTGEKAFIATYSAIAQSNLQLKKSNTLLSQFALTMKNTAKWQLSSSLLHGLISGFNQAIDYAKDLNTSLNNIQIVTGQSSAQMAEFAKQANKAAKELRSTTVAYTDAALIYYQQGLDGKAVTDRANTTVKLANVTGESAETVSQWMTAVWNNFDDGSKSLEYYADVMTALGAATASSSDEIAQGLEKFAAVADTVGLSYESATAALATITATTRQSADVVGTALKTLFARVQDLDLGKTLEDGTTLGSYSEALNKVGINIKDQSGQLKEMDDIIDEMGTKWKTLDKDQQVALAKNVAGIRQYTQLIALMDNYDFYKQNQDIASGAEGTLEEQAKIYEESWAAASKNVKASLESMYNVLIPTDFIVDFTNGLADVVSGFTDILDAAGGLKTILLLISSVVLSKFQAQIATAMDTGLQKTQALITSTQKLVEAQGGIFKAASTKIKSSFVNAAQSQVNQNHTSMNKEATGVQAEIQKGLRESLAQKDSSGNPINLSDGFKAQVKSLQQIEQYNTKILNLKDKMTQAEFEELQLTQQHLKVLGEEKAKNIDKINDLKLQLDVLKEQQGIATTRRDFQNNTATSDYALSTEEASGYMAAAKAADLDEGLLKTSMANEDTQSLEFQNIQALKTARTEILEVISNTKQAELEITDVLNNRNSYEGDFKQLITQTIDKLVEQGKLTSTQGDILKKNVGSYKNMDKLADTLKSRVQGLNNGAQAVARTLKISDGHIEDSVKHGAQLYTTNQRNAQIINETKTRTQELDQTLENIVKKGASFGNMFVKGLQGASQMAMGLSMLQGAITSIGDAFKEGDFNLSQFLSGLTSLGMAVPMVVSGFQSLMTLMSGFTAVQHLSTKASYDKITALVTEKGVATSLAAEEKILAAAKASGATVEQITIVLSELKAGKTLKEALETANLTGATWAQVAANLGLQASMWSVLSITLLVVAAFAALIGIIALVVKAFKDAEANSPEGRLKVLEEQAKKSAEAMNKVKEEVEQLQTTLDELRSAYKSLEELDRASLEWLVTITKINQMVEELIKKYPELSEYVNYDNGYAELNEEGMEKATQLANKDLVRATNVYREDQIAINEEKISQLKDKYGSTITTTSTITNFDQKNTPVKTEITSVPHDMLDPSSVQQKINSFKEDETEQLNQYLKDVEEANRLQNEINNLQDQQLQARGQALGSTRNAAELKEVLGGKDYNTLQSEQKKKIEDGGFSKEDWNDHTNYTKDSAEWSMIDDFMKTQGDDVKYVAQRHGKMVLEIDGEEVEYTREEVEKQLTELYTGDELETKLKDGLTNTLSKSLNISASNLQDLDLDTLNIIDDFKRGFDEAFKNTDLANKTDEMFQLIAGSYERAYGGIKAGLEAFSQETQYIDKTSTAFKNLAENADPNNIEDFVNSLRELNADGQLDSMTDFFAQQAEGMGLGEEEAASMQNYAKSLTDTAEASADLDDNLQYNAEAAAKVAVATTRMDKGIDTLADNYSDWNDILKNSDKTTREYSDAMLGMKKALSDVLGTSEEYISNDFVSEHLEEIEQAATGSEEAILQLQKELSKDILCQIVGVSDFSQLDADVQNMQNKIWDLSQDIQIGAHLNTGDFLTEAQNLISECGMTVDEAQAYFNSLGYEPEFVTQEETVTRSVPQEQTHTDYKITKGSINIMGADVPIPTIDRITTTTIAGYKDLEEKIQVPAISADGTPKIKSITRTGKGGKLGNYSSSGRGGKSPGSSSKSSGGSSSKTSTKTKKNLSEEGDFYHDINREIERLAETTDKLADAKDRAFGDDKIKNLNAEIRAIQAEIKAQEKLIERAKQKIELDKQALKTYGATYDKNGEITNYDQMLQNEINKYNAAVDTYNQKAAQKDAGKLSDEQWESAEKAFEAAEERYNKFEEAISTYEADLDIKDDAVEEAAEKAREILDKQLEGIQYIVDVQIEVNDRDLKVLERLLDRLEDDLYDGTERIANMTKQIDEQFDNIEIYKAGIRQTLVSAGAGQSAVDAYMAGDSTAVQGLNLTEEQMQMLQDYTDGIMESEDAIIEIREEIENQTMTTFDAWHEKIEKNGQAFEHATTMAESYKNIIDLVGKTRLKLDNSILKDLEETQMNAMTESMRNTKAQMDTTQNALNKAKEELEKARQRGNQEDIEKWEQDIETLNKTLMEDQENFVSSWEAALQTAADIFTTQMDRAFENLEDDLAGIFKSFDEFNAAMDKQQQVTDRFMDAGKKQYELSKLNRKLQQDLDKTDNTKAQKELLKLQKEIESYQESGVEMSERDLTALQKKYELKLAEIALQDAQNAKSQVRLTRDSEGNFGYVYTADESKVADAQQNYEDKLEENRQLAIEQNQQLSEAIVNNRQAMVEALREIRQEDYADTEAYMQALQETTQFYKDQEAYLISEAQKVIERSQDIYANDYLAYDGWNLQKLNSANNYNTILSDTQLQAYEQMGINTDGWVTQETETMQQLGINILDRIMNGDGASGINGIMEALGSAEDGSGFFGASRIAAEAWASSYAEIMGYAGITIDNYGNEVATVLGPDGTQKSFSDFSSAVQYALYGEGTKTKPADGSVNGAVEAAKAKTIEYAATAQEKFGAIANSVTTWQSTYSGKIKTATQDTNNLNTAIKNLLGEKIELITNIKEVQSDINKLKATIEGLGDKTFTINHNTNNTITTEYKTIGDAPNSGTQGDGIPQVGDTVTFESGVYTADSYGGGSSGSWGRGGAMKISLITDTNRARPYHLTTTSGGARGWVSLSQISGYDTGGYTGEWGPDGKLAFLHQKEIVLNASDTENLLAAVQMIREISGQLEANAMTMKYIKTLENYGTKVNIDGQTLQQDVTIHAEFPNATNHSEIEEAFRNLTNLASQYTNRKN